MVAVGVGVSRGSTWDRGGSGVDLRGVFNGVVSFSSRMVCKGVLVGVLDGVDLRGNDGGVGCLKWCSFSSGVDDV